MKIPYTKIDERIFGDGEIQIKRESTIIIDVEIYKKNKTYNIYVKSPDNQVIKILEENKNEIYNIDKNIILDQEKIKLFEKAINWKINSKYGVII